MDIFNETEEEDGSMFLSLNPKQMVMISRNSKVDNPEKQSLLEDPRLAEHDRFIQKARKEVDHLDLSSISFQQALVNPAFKFNPRTLGFIPSSFWADKPTSFEQMRADFFTRKNNSNCRFPHKLYNALILSELRPEFVDLVGCQWVDDKTIKINREKFARLLGIKSVEGSLFHKQGNFPSHGFVEVDPQVVRSQFPDFDFTSDRLLVHKDGVFVRGCSEDDISKCKWSL